MTTSSTIKRFLNETWLFWSATVLGSVVFFAIHEALANELESFLVAVCVTLTLSLLIMYRYFATKHSRLGVAEIFETFDTAPSTANIIDMANLSIDFIGISGRTFFESGEIEEMVSRKARSGVRFRFLVLDPQSRFVEQKARDEGDEPAAWRHDIKASINRLHRLPVGADSNSIQVRTYDALPIWRLLLVDGKLGYVTYYPHGGRGKQMFMLAMDNQIGKLYPPFADYYSYVWDHVARTID